MSSKSIKKVAKKIEEISSDTSNMPVKIDILSVVEDKEQKQKRLKAKKEKQKQKEENKEELKEELKEENKNENKEELKEKPKRVYKPRPKKIKEMPDIEIPDVEKKTEELPMT